MSAGRSSRRRPDRDRQVRPRRRARPAARRRDRQRRLDAALPRAWTSAPRSCPGRAAAASRTTCSTSGPSPSRPRSPSTRRWPAPRSTTIARPRPACRSWSAAPGCTCAARSTELEFPGDRPGAPGPAGRRAGRARPGGAARPAGRGRPGRGRSDPADQRAPDRARAGGHRADRPAVHRDACPASSRVRHRPDRARPRRPGRAGRAPGATGCGRPACVDEVRGAAGRRAARRPDGGQGARLRSRCSAASTTRRRDGDLARRSSDRPGDPPVRAPAAVLVPPRPAGALARRAPRPT